MDRMNQDSNTSSAVTTVLQCNPILTEILLKLPQKSIFKFKCVSRDWNSLISSPYFRRRYISQIKKSSSLPLLGFFHGTTTLQRKIPRNIRAPPLSFLSTCEEGESIKSHSFIKKVGFLVGSSQGLILCGYHPVIYYVCNPITNQWLSLPKPRMDDHGCAIGFSCEEESSDVGVIHFKVIRVGLDIDNMLQIETFSSRTGEWKESMLTCPCKVVLEPYSMCHVVGGILYWKALGEYVVDFIAAYDPNNMGNNSHIWLTRLPNDIWPGLVGAIGQSSDGLLQCALCDHEGFTVWVLSKKLTHYSFSITIPSSQWIMTHEVKYKNLFVDYPNTMNLANIGDNPRPWGFPKYPLLTAFHPRDTRIVYLWLGLMIFSYNLETRKVQLLEYHGRAYPTTYYDLFPYVQCAWPDYLPLIANGMTNSTSSSSFIQRRRSNGKRKGVPIWKAITRPEG